MRYPEWFDLKTPSKTWVKENCNVYQLDETDGRYVADAVLELTLCNQRARKDEEKETVLVLPPNAFWDRGRAERTYRGQEVLDSPRKFKKFGPELNLNRSHVTKEQAKNHKHLPEKRMGQILDDSGRMVQLYGFPDLSWDPRDDYRGVGWWGPTKHMHHIHFLTHCSRVLFLQAFCPEK